MRLQRILNAIAHPWTEYQVSRAKAEYRAKHPDCECCGRPPSFFGATNDVHHRRPVHIRPDLACDQANLMTMCRLCHWLIGHLKDWKSWNVCVDGTVESIRMTINEASMKWKVK